MEATETAKTDNRRKWNRSNLKPLIKLYESGKTLQEVGDIYHLCRERVRQLFESVGYQRRRQTYSMLYLETITKSGKARRKDLPKEELERLYLKEKLKLKEIADLLNASVPNVYQNLIRFEIPRRSRQEAALLFLVKNPDLTKEKLHRLYIVENQSRSKVAGLSGYSVSAIARLTKKYGLRKVTGKAYEKRYGRPGKQLEPER